MLRQHNRRGFWAVLMLTLVLVTSSTVYCNAAGSTQDWQVPMFGTLKVPPGFHAADVKELMQLLEQEKENLKLDSAPALVKDKWDERVDFNIYQLTTNDGQTYRQAWVLAVKDKNPTQGLDEFFIGPMNVEKRVKAVLFHDKMAKELAQLATIDPKTGFGVEIIEMSPPDMFEVQGVAAVAGSIRLLVKYRDFWFPLHARGYVFALDGRLAALLVVTTDSERSYWNKLLDDAVRSMEYR